MTAEITEEKIFGWLCGECSEGEDCIEQLATAERHAYEHDVQNHELRPVAK